MTDAEKIVNVKSLVENDEDATDALVSVYLASAKAAILRRLYPFGIPTDADVPDLYEFSQCELAARYFLRRGAQGETAHNENGIQRTYGSVNDEDILREVVPYGRVFG